MQQMKKASKSDMYELDHMAHFDTESSSLMSSKCEENQRLMQSDEEMGTNWGRDSDQSFLTQFWEDHGGMSLDAFLHEIYEYYLGKGLVCIILSEFLNLLILMFVINLITFIFVCIDFPLLLHGSDIKDWRQVIHIINLFSSPIALTIWVFIGIFSIIKVCFIIKRWYFLRNVHFLYNKVLMISDNDDLPSIPWSNVVFRLMQLNETHPLSTEPDFVFDAHSIANRLMRQENYMISIFNLNVLNLNITPTDNPSHQWYTKYMEWNISWALEKMVFNEDRQLRSDILMPENEQIFASALRQRFQILGFLNLVLSPVIVIYLSIYFLIHLGSEIHSNYGKIAYRQYSNLAKILFREFNELPHILDHRLNESAIYCDEYLNQFPSLAIAHCARLVVFVSGSVALLLALLGLLNEDILLHSEGFRGRSLIWYVGLFGGLLAAARTLIPDEHQVYRPQEIITWIIEFTHYRPNSWRNRLHSRHVFKEFQILYQMRWQMYLQEIVSVLIVPFIFLTRLPDKSDLVVKFFRDYSVHVPGLGHVCSYALFDFKKHGDIKYGSPEPQLGPQNPLKSSQGKLEKSLLGFKSNYPDWNPKEPDASQFLERIEYQLQGQTRSNMSSIGPPMKKSIGPDMGFVSILHNIYDHQSQNDSFPK